MQKMNWKNRIVREAVEDPEQLLANPFNNKIHTQVQQDTTAALLDTVGWVQKVLVNERTGHVVDGHMRILLAMKYQQRSIPVTYLDLTEDEEKLVLLTLDPVGRLAVYDSDLTGQLIDMISTDNAAIEALLVDLNDTLGSPPAPGTSDGEGESRQGLQSKNKVNFVLFTAQIGTFEKALALTGKVNRAEALIEVCEAYLAKGQYDPAPEGFAETLPAVAD